MAARCPNRLSGPSGRRNGSRTTRVPGATGGRPAPPARRARRAVGGDAEHGPDGVVELADAGEAGTEGDVGHGQRRGLDQHPGRLGPLGPGQRHRAGPDLGEQQALELADAVAEFGGQARHPGPVDHAVGDQPHGPADHVGTDVPLRRSRGGVGPATLAGPEPGPLGGGRRGQEPHVATERRAGRAARPAVDPGGGDRGHEPPVEPRVARLHGEVAAVGVVVHPVSLTDRPSGGLAEIRHGSRRPGRVGSAVVGDPPRPEVPPMTDAPPSSSTRTGTAAAVVGRGVVVAAASALVAAGAQPAAGRHRRRPRSRSAGPPPTSYLGWGEPADAHRGHVSHRYPRLHPGLRPGRSRLHTEVGRHATPPRGERRRRHRRHPRRRRRRVGLVRRLVGPQARDRLQDRHRSGRRLRAGHRRLRAPRHRRRHRAHRVHQPHHPAPGDHRARVWCRWPTRRSRSPSPSGPPRPAPTRTAGACWPTRRRSGSCPTPGRSCRSTSACPSRTWVPPAWPPPRACTPT